MYQLVESLCPTPETNVTLCVNETSIQQQNHQIKLLTDESSLADWTKGLPQALRHLNDQPAGPVAPHARLRTPGKAPNSVKIRKSWETAIVPALTGEQWAMLLGTPSPIVSGKGIIYQNLPQDVPSGRGSYVTPPGARELSNPHWDSVVLLRAGAAEVHYMQNGMCTTERGQKLGAGHIPPQSIFTRVTVPPPPANMDGMHNHQFPKGAHLPLLKVDTVFQKYTAAAIWVPFAGLEVTAHVEALTEFNQPGLDDNQQSLYPNRMWGVHS